MSGSTYYSGIHDNRSANKPIHLSWKLGYTKAGDNSKIIWTKAAVPGAIQLDIAKKEKYGSHVYAENWSDYSWMEDHYFTYRTTFRKPAVEDSQRILFISKGIDYEFKISLNGNELLHQEGMFTPVRLDITDKLQEINELSIKIFPIPKAQHETADKTQADQSVKPAVSYGWDWHPRLVPVGIWDETRIEIVPESHLIDAWLNYNLNDQFDHARIEIQLSGVNLHNKEIHWILTDDLGMTVLTETRLADHDKMEISSSLKHPQLWWPHDHGEPYLYSSVFELRDENGILIQTIYDKIGFRRVQLVMNSGAWLNPVEFPKSRSVAPIQLEINGRKIFSKGSNWVNPDIFPGTLTPERYSELIDKALEINFNLLRVWGGGIVNKESFYDLCDEKGIMVWQEFPLACNNYRGTTEYLATLEQESASIVKRIRTHPSLAIWSGGNELFNSWSGMTDQSLALRLLNSQCLHLDPQTPYINTSPLTGMGHGPYVFRDMETGDEVFSIINRASNTAYTEFGIPSPSSVEILRKIIPENELWPPSPGTSWESHHAYNAWMGDTWLMQEMIEDYFGKAENLEDLVANGQLLQCEGYKAIYEEARRQKPYCSMALNWCFNEPWPTAANNSLINWPMQPKPAFYAVGNSCRPVICSARITKFIWHEGETFFADLWLLNDLFETINSGKICIKLVAGEEEIEIHTWEYSVPEPNTNLPGPRIKWVLPSWDVTSFNLMLEVEGKPEYNSEYVLLYQKK